MFCILVDSGPLIAYYNIGDAWHERVKTQFGSSTCQFVTSAACIAETMWMLSSDVRVQNEFLLDLASGIYRVESLLEEDYSRIAALNLKYKDMPADFADLSIVALAERLQIDKVLSLDQDFDIYRRFGNKPFHRVALPGGKSAGKGLRRPKGS